MKYFYTKCALFLLVLYSTSAIADVTINGIKVKDNGSIVFSDNSEQSTATMQGPSGAQGTGGLNSLISLTPEPAGANCLNGGVTISVGLDTNKNSALDSGEITSSTYVCNGTTNPCIDGPGQFNYYLGGYSATSLVDFNLQCTDTMNQTVINKQETVNFTGPNSKYTNKISQVLSPGTYTCNISATPASGSIGEIHLLYSYYKGPCRQNKDITISGSNLIDVNNLYDSDITPLIEFWLSTPPYTRSFNLTVN